MKSIYLFIIINFYSFLSINAQVKIIGTVTDHSGEPLIGVNVFVVGSLDGCTTNINGEFNFLSSTQGEQTLKLSFIGFQEINYKSDVNQMQDLRFVMEEAALSLEEITISANTFSLNKSRGIKELNELDVVLTGSSNGDIIGALQALPGTQTVSEDGRLFVRGGESRESQLFIDDLHVLKPYTVHGNNVAVRSKFSPFLFKGINLSTGGYSSEYGQALSSVLPMETKDVSSSDKSTIQLSPLSIGGGGTYIWNKQSVSAQICNTNLSLYNKVFPDNATWTRAYQNLTGEVQLKTEIGRKSIHKVYFAYDNTSFAQCLQDPFKETEDRNLDLHSNNYYLNTSFRTQTTKNYHLFTGFAYSNSSSKYLDALTPNDLFKENEEEYHIKIKGEKSYSKYYKIRTGAESYFKKYGRNYKENINDKGIIQEVNQFIPALFMDHQLLLSSIYFNISGRLEYNSFLKKTYFAPRLSVNYIKEKYQLGGTMGKYYQSFDPQILLSEEELEHSASAWHYIISASYLPAWGTLKAEVYHKDYDHLNLIQNGVYSSEGFGNSKGVDIFFTGELNCISTKYTLSYSYNDSKRLYKDFEVLSTPSHVSSHGVTISTIHSIPKLKTYMGLSYTFASGRTYTDPNRSGFLNSTSPNYHSLDVNFTYLINERVILYSSITNVLGRKNTFGYTYSKHMNNEGRYSGKALTASRDRFIYIALFISLWSDSAYDVSNF